MTDIALLAAAPVLAACTAAAAFAAQRHPWHPDLAEAADLLAWAKLGFPAADAGLWQHDDGLPAPEDSRFAQAAVGFLVDHPVPAAAGGEAKPWDLARTASRQLKCLAYLASGGGPERREVAQLCVAQAMRLLWILPVRSGHRRSPDRDFYAAAGALSATGGLLCKSATPGSAAFEVGTQWLRTGLGQFETYGGEGDAAQHQATTLIGVAGASVDELEIHGTDREFFTQIDTNRADMSQVATRLAADDPEGAKEAYVQALAGRFSGKRGWPNIDFWKGVDLEEADDICRNVFLIRAHMHRRYDYGEEVDWAEVIDNDIESRVWMNHHPWSGTLVNAYQETADDKYVTHLCRLFNSWYETSPTTFKRSSAQWRTLEAGGRVGQRWGVVLLTLAEHPVFRRECLFNMARSMLDHGKYLSMYAAGGGNWLQVESAGLACIALLFPEFRLSPLFYETAMNRLAWVNARAFLADGFQSECSPGYHYFPLRGIATVMRLANSLHAPIPESLGRQYEAGVEALQHICYPDRTLPMLSDWNPQRSSVVAVLETGAEVFDREDFRWLATEGSEGRPPAEASYDFTHAGYCVMRDKWGSAGQMLIFDAGYFGAGHQHEDKLSFVYYAGGRELIGDPGIYSYKRDEFEPYWRGSWSHNILVIDGLSQHRSLGPREKMPDPDRRFVMGEGFDFAVGWYRRAYSPRGAALWGGDAKSGRDAAIRDVQHQRCVFYVKGRYAIVCDRVLGEGEHQTDLLFHPAPVVTGEGVNRKARAVDLDTRPDGTVITKEPKHANVAILPARGHDFEVLDIVGRKDPVRGWFALYGIVPSHDIVYRSRATLPRHFETVVQPLPAGVAEPMRVQSLDVKPQDGMTCAAITCGDDLFLLSYDGPADMVCEGVHFSGTALLLSRDKQGRLVRASMVDARAVTVGERQVLASDTPKRAQTLDL